MTIGGAWRSAAARHRPVLVLLGAGLVAKAAFDYLNLEVLCGGVPMDRSDSCLIGPVGAAEEHSFNDLAGGDLRWIAGFLAVGIVLILAGVLSPLVKRAALLDPLDGGADGREEAPDPGRPALGPGPVAAPGAGEPDLRHRPPRRRRPVTQRPGRSPGGWNSDPGPGQRSDGGWNTDPRGIRGHRGDDGGTTDPRGYPADRGGGWSTDPRGYPADRGDDGWSTDPRGYPADRGDDGWSTDPRGYRGGGGPRSGEHRIVDGSAGDGPRPGGWFDPPDAGSPGYGARP